ncbi:hypothetical protein PP175_27565 (plasmid) [Aneurinibacillus sp. Ricciae_BoGa-3]|uniref:hypothetical protein n=1 Tax=Aneurinibacillus sp. Ricciae_BoGa-3 TaxID=3022697 RepID=UPI002341BD1B|nr:hypothetical protein [Aneurinibacillus sp. Ricciae_BoGa-3]WCK56952.1 hypothetical protein PP175_27565 [Aneurinibacillus sp. Ricciae_BoGa-3]
MSILLIVKGILIVIATVLAIISLVRLSKKKKHFQIFPESIKKEYFKEARMMTILNLLSVAFIFVSFFLIHNNMFFLPVTLSLFLSLNALFAQEEDFGDLNNDKHTKK